MIAGVADQIKAPVLAVANFWFGNNGLWAPLENQLDQRFDLLSRMRSNQNLFDLPAAPDKARPGRPKKYGRKLGDTSSLAAAFKDRARQYEVNLYGRLRALMAYDQVVMLKTLKCAARVVWAYRKTHWVAFFSTDLQLSVEQIIEYYGARWKIEAAFKELKQDIGSADTQSRHPEAVKNHLHFSMVAMNVAWIYAGRLKKTPQRRHAVDGRNHFAFSDVRRLVAKAALDDNFTILYPARRKSLVNSLLTSLLRMAA